MRGVKLILAVFVLLCAPIVALSICVFAVCFVFVLWLSAD